ncbi:MAG: hypothetical protein M3Z25_22310, partial [Actinomycetota bacterium]|nr:hypothetical protein [Actinomycetota bacterium]
ARDADLPVSAGVPAAAAGGMRLGPAPRRPLRGAEPKRSPGSDHRQPSSTAVGAEPPSGPRSRAQPIPGPDAIEGWPDFDGPSR